tara:strand:+ start:167 stop:391 length:225 start_codon:yes stop_codon:yes gene_type:complete
VVSGSEYQGDSQSPSYSNYSLLDEGFKSMGNFNQILGQINQKEELDHVGPSIKYAFREEEQLIPAKPKPIKSTQ